MDLGPIILCRSLAGPSGPRGGGGGWRRGVGGGAGVGRGGGGVFWVVKIIHMFFLYEKSLLTGYDLSTLKLSM